MVRDGFLGLFGIQLIALRDFEVFLCHFGNQFKK